MPQVLKPEVRERIEQAALRAFASRGYAAAAMGDIAREAGMAVANLYRYHASKEELFEAVLPRKRVAELEALLARSVRAHAQLAGMGGPADAAAAAAARELLDFWIEHRLSVVILLLRAGGSAHAGFAERFVERLVALSVAEIRAAYPGAVVSREARFVLRQVFDNTRRMIGAILEECEEEGAIRRAVEGFRSYQVAGLAAFASWVANAAVQGPASRAGASRAERRRGGAAAPRAAVRAAQRVERSESRRRRPRAE